MTMCAVSCGAASSAERKIEANMGAKYTRLAFIREAVYMFPRI
jgi:hypothetical protein